MTVYRERSNDINAVQEGSHTNYVRALRQFNYVCKKCIIIVEKSVGYNFIATEISLKSCYFGNLIERPTVNVEIFDGCLISFLDSTHEIKYIRGCTSLATRWNAHVYGRKFMRTKFKNCGPSAESAKF